MTQSDQQTFWNGDAGGTWVAQQKAFDALMQPVLDTLWQKASLAPGATVLDIGCGTGASVLQAAQQVGPDGHVTGVDISAPMLALAATRTKCAQNITLMQADAATHTFEGAGFDHLISRFGVMFFGDTTAAFRHILNSLRPGAKVTFATWGAIEMNPWFTLSAKAAKTVLGAPPAVDPDDPGPFALRDRAKTTDMLASAGFADVSAVKEDLHLTPAGTRDQAAAFAVSAGPPKRTMDHFNATPEDGAKITAVLTELFAPFVTPQGLRIPAEINFFSARAPR
ncbi:MAG: class I SAM-dependent methyltransferase [Roseobacter sp.]